MQNITTKWNLALLLKNPNDMTMEAEKKDLLDKAFSFEKKWKEREDYLQEPAVLKEALDEYENWVRYHGSSGRTGYYTWLKYQLDQNNSDLKAQINKLEELGTEIGTRMQFFLHRISLIKQSDQQKFLDFPQLSKYKHLLEMLFSDARYLLSEAEEKVLTMKAPVSRGKWIQMTSNFLTKEEREVLSEEGIKQKLSFSEIVSLTKSQDKNVRDTAATVFNEILQKHADVAEYEMNAILTDKKVEDNLRNVERPDKLRHVSDDIDTEVVDTLLESVSKRYDISRGFYELKAKLFGVEKLMYHERNVEYGSIDKKYEYEEGVDLIGRTLLKLDKDFYDIFVSYVENGQIDVYPKTGKAPGGFCTTNLMTLPTFILLNYTKDLNDVLTLGHEMGHAINYEFMKKTQDALNFGNSLAVAEVASTFIEEFVLKEIMADASEGLRLSLLMSKLNGDISTIQRQVACYRFEQELHSSFRDKGFLSKDDIGEIFSRHMTDYMGNYVEKSEGSQNWWVYWTHIRSFFYVYSYALGLLVSKAVYAKVKEDSNYITQVKDFLSRGMESSPAETFRNIGIDISNSNILNKGLDEEQELLDEAWTLARKLGKIS